MLRKTESHAPVLHARGSHIEACLPGSGLCERVANNCLHISFFTTSCAFVSSLHALHGMSQVNRDL